MLAMLRSETLIQRAVSNLGFIGQEILVATSNDRTDLGLGSFPNVRLVQDRALGRGPLEGIYCGLEESSFQLNLVVGGDMPFVNKELVNYMFDQVGDFDAVVPRLRNTLEPLHGIYRKSAKCVAQKLIDSGVFAISRMLGLIRVRYIEEEEIDHFDPSHLSFFNVNRSEDFKAALLMTTGRGFRRQLPMGTLGQ